MPRRKRHVTIRELHRETIRKQSGSLLTAIDNATLSLSLVTLHGEALMKLRRTLIGTETFFTTDRRISSARTRHPANVNRIDPAADMSDRCANSGRGLG